MQDEKFTKQSNQYSFPYHYIAMSEKKDYSDLTLTRRMDWGLEYLYILDSVASLITDNSKILDVGCGDGRLFSRIGAFCNNFEYLGIDLDIQPIELAKAINPHGKFTCGSIFDHHEFYDFISMVEVLEHIPDNQIDDFLSTLKKNMHKESKLIITVPSNLRKVHKKHYRHYDKDLLSKQLLRNGFHIERIDNCYCETKISIFLTKLISNSFYTINNSHIKKLLISLVLKIARKNKNGAHLLCVANVES